MLRVIRLQGLEGVQKSENYYNGLYRATLRIHSFIPSSPRASRKGNNTRFGLELRYQRFGVAFRV